jgi:hypothetical protein
LGYWAKMRNLAAGMSGRLAFRESLTIANFAVGTR